MIDIRERINAWLRSVGYVEGKSGSTAAIYPEDRVSLTTTVEAMVLEAQASESDKWQEVVALKHRHIAVLQDQISQLQTYKDIAQALTTDEWMVVTARVEKRKEKEAPSELKTLGDYFNQAIINASAAIASSTIKGWKP